MTPNESVAVDRQWPQPIDWRGWCVLFFLSGGMASIGGVMLYVGEPWWKAALPLVAFGIGPIVCLIRLWPGSSFVRVSSRGLELCEFIRPVCFAWTEIAAVQLVGETVQFTWRPRAVSEYLATPDGAGASIEDDVVDLPTVRGISAADLAQLLTDFCSRFGTENR